MGQPAIDASGVVSLQGKLGPIWVSSGVGCCNEIVDDYMVISTAAHNIYRPNTGPFFRSVRAVSTIGGKRYLLKVLRIILPEEWVSRGYLLMDIAFMIVRVPSNRKAAMAVHRPLWCIEVPEDEVYVVRNGVRTPRLSSAVQNFTISRCDVQAHADLLEAECASSVGDSGAPWFVLKDQNLMQVSNTSFRKQSKLSSTIGPRWGGAVFQMFERAKNVIIEDDYKCLFETIGKRNDHDHST